jgi:hypothetical protein
VEALGARGIKSGFLIKRVFLRAVFYWKSLGDRG